MTIAPHDLDREALVFAKSICTDKQMEVLYLRADGLGYRAIARRLQIAPQSAKDRLNGAMLHLQKAILELEELAAATAEK